MDELTEVYSWPRGSDAALGVCYTDENGRITDALIDPIMLRQIFTYYQITREDLMVCHPNDIMRVNPHLPTLLFCARRTPKEINAVYEALGSAVALIVSFRDGQGLSYHQEAMDKILDVVGPYLQSTIPPEKDNG